MYYCLGISTNIFYWLIITNYSIDFDLSFKFFLHLALLSASYKISNFFPFTIDTDSQNVIQHNNQRNKTKKNLIVVIIDKYLRTQ